MPINNQSLNKELYKILKVRGFDPIPKDSTGETSPVPDEADVFKYTFKSGDEAKGTAYATIDGDNTLTIYYGDDVTRKVNEEDGTESFDLTWTGFLKNMKMWAQRHQMGFELQNKDHLHSDMAQRNYTKKQENMSESKRLSQLQGQDMDKINEGYFPNGKLSSYNDNIPTVKIVLQHTRAIQEGEQRYRNVARIYLENVQGERILAPTVKPGIAQIYARHLAEGGVPNDERWNHIKSLCEEYSKMAGFVRAVRGNQFNESAQRLVEAGLNHYTNLRETLGKMRGQRGYNSYFESWTPTLMENEGDENTLNELFVQETLDPRIESVMPILNKLSKTISEVKEVKELEEWAESLTEAPGAETLAHNQATASSNLKAFDLEEDTMNEGWFADTLRNVGKAVLDRLAPNDKQLLLKLQQDMGVPTTAQHGKPSMARTMSDEEVQKLIAVARKVNAGRNSSLSEEEVEESGLQAYLGNKKYGKKGMDALRKAGRDGASKEKMAKIRAKYDKLDEEGVAEADDPTSGTTKKYPNTKEGVLQYMQSPHGYNKSFLKQLDLPTCKIRPDPSIEGVWTVDSMASGYRCIIYLAGYRDQWGEIRRENDNEEGSLPEKMMKSMIENKTLTPKMIKTWTKLGSVEPEVAEKLISYHRQIFGKQGVAETQVSKHRELGATSDTTHFIKNIKTGKIVSPHRSLKDAKDALVAYGRDGKGDDYKIVRARNEGVAEGTLNELSSDLLNRAARQSLERGSKAQQDIYNIAKSAFPLERHPIDDTSARNASIIARDYWRDRYRKFANRSELQKYREVANATKNAMGLSPAAQRKLYIDLVNREIKAIEPHIKQSLSDPYTSKRTLQQELDNVQTPEARKYFLDLIEKHFELKKSNQGVAEDLDANQKRVGQLGPTENVGPKGAVGKLVGANESVEHDPLQDIKRLLGK